MKPAVVTLLLLFASTAFAGWSSSGPIGGLVNAVVVAPSNPAVIWAGNAAGVFRSTDGGASWANVSGPVIDVAYLAVHPGDPDKAWALTSSEGVYRTIDGGATWSNPNRDLLGVIPSGLFIDPRNPDTLYASGSCGSFGFEVALRASAGFYKSTDGGATWNRDRSLSPLSQCVYEMGIDPFSPWRLFIKGPYSDIAGSLESYDGSQTWERPDGPRPSLAVVFDARFPFTHYGITEWFGGYFLVSQDGGFTWSAVPGTLPAAPRALSMDPERSRIFLGTTNGVLRSGNGGRVWANTNVPQVDVKALDFGGVPRALFAATGDGLFAVTDRGLGAPRPIDLRDISADVLGLAIDPSDPNAVFASAVSSTPLRGRFFRSTNTGASWERLSGDNGVAIDLISVDAAGTVYASSHSSNTLFGRGRGDVAWTVIKHDIFIDDIAADPKNAGIVFIGNTSSVERSRDGGATWKATGVRGGHLAIDAGDPRWVYAAGEDHLYRSSDGGDTWTDLQPQPLLNGTRAIAVAPSNGMVLYRVGANVGSPRMERSDDRAVTWLPVPLPGGAFASSIAVDPRDEHSVWAGALDQGLFHSVNGGANWERVDGPFGTPFHVAAMRFDATGRVLHIAYQGHGMWELTVDGL